MTYRSHCNCPCHIRPYDIHHAVACCVPDEIIPVELPDRTLRNAGEALLAEQSERNLLCRYWDYTAQMLEARRRDDQAEDDRCAEVLSDIWCMMTTTSQATVNRQLSAVWELYYNPEPKQRMETICACTLATPCSYACSCANPLMSGGCQRCASYGSEEQRKAAALLITSQPNPERYAPVQGFSGGIPWSLHLRAYDAYCKKHGRQEALIDLEGRNCRGGFGTTELDEFIPGWRAEVSLIKRLQRQISHLLPDPWPRCEVLAAGLQFVIAWRHNPDTPWVYWTPDTPEQEWKASVEPGLAYRFNSILAAQTVCDLFNVRKKPDLVSVTLHPLESL